MYEKNYYSEKEDIRFSNEVVAFNKLEDGSEEKELVRTRIRDRTQILIYQLSIRNLFLTSDEASEIYLNLRDDVDRIISSYTITKATFNQFITQICKYEKLSITKKRYREKSFEDSFAYTLSFEYEDEELEFFQTEPHYGIARPEIFQMGIKSLVSYIVENRDNNKISGTSRKERLLSLALKEKRNRRYMLYYLLTLPQCEGPEFIDCISRVFCLDSMVISYFYSLRFDLLTEINKRWEKSKMKANSHFSAMLRLMSRMAFEKDEKKMKFLQASYTRENLFHQACIKEAKHKKRGLTQEQAADVLDIKRGTISYGIKHTKNILESIIAKSSE